MNIEIERKFLIDVNRLPESFKAAGAFEIVQTYISFSPGTRIRKINNSNYYFTKKVPIDAQGLAHEETEYMITPEEYQEFLKKQVGNTVHKTRYELCENKAKIEVDIYSHGLTGLAVAEVEFRSVKEAEAFVPPAWFGLEVTSDSRYKNMNLARYGMPKP